MRAALTAWASRFTKRAERGYSCGRDRCPVADVKGVTTVDILPDRLSRLNVPILGGFPIGHGKHPATVPSGTHAILDADARLLEVESGGEG